MSFGTDIIMPLDPQVYLAMIFFGGPAIMASLYGIDVALRQKLRTLCALGFSGYGVWYYCVAERIVSPLF